MQTTTEQRIAAEINLLQFVIDNMPISDIVTEKRVFLGSDGSYKALLFDIDGNYYLYNLGNDINDTIKVLETIKEEWS